MILVTAFIGIHFSRFADLAPITFGVHPECDFSRPAGGDGLVKRGDCATSGRTDLLNGERLISPVGKSEGVLENSALINLFEVEDLILQVDPWPCRLLCNRDRELGAETKCNKSDMEQELLHLSSLLNIEVGFCPDSCLQGSVPRLRVPFK